MMVMVMMMGKMVIRILSCTKHDNKPHVLAAAVLQSMYMYNMHTCSCRRLCMSW
jgi:hypothetical protein